MIIAKKFNENVLKLSYCEAGACEAGVGRVEPSHTIHTRGNDVSSKQELLSYFQKVSENCVQYLLCEGDRLELLFRDNFYKSIKYNSVEINENKINLIKVYIV